MLSAEITMLPQNYVKLEDVFIVGQCIHDNGDSVGTVSFICNVFIIYISNVPGSLFDAAHGQLGA